MGNLVLSGTTLYGTASGGGTNGNGTVFSINISGGNFTVLHTFTATSFFSASNLDGASPAAGLVLSGHTLHGTTEAGGTNSGGVVFSLNTNGSGFAVLHNFAPKALDPALDILTNADGAWPQATLFLDGAMLYGTAEFGGTNGYGTVYSLETNGSNFSVLYTFPYNERNDDTNGANPIGGLILADDTLYGTTSEGGTNGTGTLFSIGTNSDDFSVLHVFEPTASVLTNSDGWDPQGTFDVSGRTLYDTVRSGGLHGGGTIFSMNTNGANFTLLHTFGGTDGLNPEAGLLLAGNTLYGTASEGGAGNGTIFSLSTNGSNFAVLHAFAASPNTNNADGENPVSGLVMSGNTLYGTTRAGSPYGYGTIFALKLSSGPIALNIQSIGNRVTLTWEDASFSLQSAPSLTGPWTTLTTATSPYTTGSTNRMQFFRLIGSNGL